MREDQESHPTVTILLVEDEAALRSLTKKVLERSGYTVLTAASALEARQLWDTRQEEVDLLFTDLNLAGGPTGQQLAVELRGQRPELRVLYTSGDSADCTHSASFRDGDHFMAKPYSLKTLTQTVEQMVACKPAAL
jgi:two-component system cell cycle sensor histidine kinase/response regulator CckA